MHDGIWVKSGPAPGTTLGLCCPHRSQQRSNPWQLITVVSRQAGKGATWRLCAVCPGQYEGLQRELQHAGEGLVDGRAQLGSVLP